MRLHRLRVQAFGPFAGVEEVDVDDLSSAGLFLLHGPTGAGKTSVLDAVCFALYGRVPGARGHCGRLRSDHAPAHVAPEVQCELTVGSRRFEVTRSPAWDRPKKRGGGRTTEPASTVLRERMGGEWIPLSSRNDEASQVLTDCLGMGIEQFSKVVLLPQGEFAAFLRAGAEERRPLLQRLFGTDRFAAVETWLSDERRRLARLVEDADARVDRLLAQADQAVAGLPLDDGQGPAENDAEDPVARIERLDVVVRVHAESCRAERSRALAIRNRLVERRDAERTRAQQAQRLAATVAEAAALEAEAPSVEILVQELDAARRAAGLAGHLEGVQGARDRLGEAEQATRECQRRLGDSSLGEEVTGPQRVTDLRSELARLAALGDSATEATRLRQRADALALELAGAEAALQALDDAATRRRREREALNERLGQLGPPAAQLAAAAAAVEAAEAAHAAAAEAESLRQEARDAADLVLATTSRAHDARAAWLDARECRLAGMAAELATALRDGSRCPVCGSVEHPAPATPRAHSISARQEDAARAASDVAEHGRAAAERALVEVRERLAAARTAAGGLAPDAARHQLVAARQRAEAARAAAAGTEVARRRLTQIDAADREDVRRRQAQTECAAAARAEEAGCRTRYAQLEVTVRTACGDDAHLAARIDRLSRLADGLEALREAQAVEALAAAACDRTSSAAERACLAAGFGATTAALAASRSPARLIELEERIRTHHDRLAACRGRLAEPELEAAATDGVDADALMRTLADLDAAVGDADCQLDAAARALALAEQAALSLADLLEHTAADVAAATPLRVQHATVDALARCAEGTGADNSLRMRLSAFVLAARLEQVAEAATLRLTVMSGGRYALVHSDAAERRGARSGLGLRVVDAWTGAQRDPGTLSGGESFLVSLALALGLADVVQAEAGGTAIETLLVDEGFGTLDEEALDEVMATLDGLREGGRAVGLVSHVAELRQRIPNRLEVVRTRSGSHLRTSASPSSGAA